IGGAAHLFGGEDRLLADAQCCLARQGLTARFAIAPTVGAAWALAHYGPDRAILAAPTGSRAERSDPARLCTGSVDAIAGVLAELPVAALRLGGGTLSVLRRLGLQPIGDLAGIGRDALRRRFRQHSPDLNPLIRLDQMLGRAPEPLVPVVAVQPAWVQCRLPEPVRHREWLEHIVADLARDMAHELEARGEGARRLELGLWRVDGEMVVRNIELAAATRDPMHMARLFKTRLDSVDAGF